MDAQRGTAGGDGLREGERGLLLFRIEAYRSRLRLAVAVVNLHALKFDLGRIQRDGAGGFLDIDFDGFRAGERGGLQVGRELKRIMRGNDVCGQSLRLRSVGEAEKKTEECGESATISALQRRIPADFHRVPH